MRYTEKTDIYRHIQIDMRICWVDSFAMRNPKVHRGIVTEIIECDSRKPDGNCNDGTCYIQIGINGEEPECYMNVENETFIRWIEDVEFIEENEFVV